MKRISTALFTLFFCLTLSAFGAERPIYTCYRLAKAPVIDGDISDWPNLPVIFLGRQDQVSSGNWKGPDDCHALIRLGWDDKALYFAIEVTDDHLTQDLPDSGAEGIWSQDSVQWAIDLSATGTLGYDGDDYEYGFGKTASGPCVYRWHVSSASLVPGKTDQVSLAIKKTKTGLVYEAAVPFEQLIPLRPTPNMQIGFTLLIQDADPAGKKTLEWTSGISAGKAPGQFGLLVFSPATATSGSGDIFLSGQSKIGSDPVTYEVVAPGLNGPTTLAWKLTASTGRTVASGTTEAAPFRFSLTPKKIKPGSYTLSAEITGKTLTKPLQTGIPVERIEVELTQFLQEKIKQQITELKKVIARAGKKKIETAYAEAARTVAELYLPFIEDDLKKNHQALALRNAKSITAGLEEEKTDLLRQIQNGPDEFLRIPRPDMSKLIIKEGEFYVGNHPVLLVGMASWMWQIREDRDRFAALGYNTIRPNIEPVSICNDQGKIPTDFPWWGMLDSIRAARSGNMSIGTLAHASQVWSVLGQKGRSVTTPNFKQGYIDYLTTLIQHLGKGTFFYYTIATENQRPRPAVAEHLDLYHAWLKSEYPSIQNYNQVCGKNFKTFSEVDFPSSGEKNPARRFDQAAFTAKLNADLLKWSADQVRKLDPNTAVGAYITWLDMDDESDFFSAGLDPELDLQAYDICDADTAGNFAGRKFAMDTTIWLAMYRDLMGGLAPGKPQFDGEFHFVNERRSYPDNWTRAIYFQAYLHGISGTYAWIWLHNDTVDSAVLLDAQVTRDLSRTALDLRRLAQPIAVFHKEQPQVAILYSHPSTPYRHLNQMKTVYEGLFFEGIKLGFISERQIERGNLSQYKLLIVPAAGHVSDKMVDEVNRFAQNGGQVLLAGNCFTNDHRSQPRVFSVTTKNIQPFPAFENPTQARAALAPILAKLKLLPPVQVKSAGSGFPVVEWRYAKAPDGTEFLYLLNMGHTPVTVNLSKSEKPLSGTDLITGKDQNSTLILKSLDVKFLKLKN
jgi:hypothetical protein